MLDNGRVSPILERMIIEVYADVLCGWAYIGKRRLEHALRLLDRPATVLWRPFLIDPTAPQWSTSLTSVVELPGVAEEVTRCGSGSLDENRDRIREAAREEGIEGDFGARLRASSWGAHRLITAALRHGPDVQDRLVEELFHTHLVRHTDVVWSTSSPASTRRIRSSGPPGRHCSPAGRSASRRRRRS
jgi:predicted DsbA family dithiol-disulfide isomerase